MSDTTTPAGDALCFRPATELLRLMRSKQVSAREVMRAHLDQIARLNPRVNAIVTMVAEDELMAEALRLDEAWARGAWAGPLHGLPLTHKDLTPTAGVRTTFGSPIFADFVPAHDAIVVERTRAAGALMLGKSNTPEFGAGSQTFNPVFGATRNPYDLTRTPGGSTGGGAVALACGMSALACGSDMGGSLRNPAAWTNTVGLRPSPGRVPSLSEGNAWGTLSVEGPMARTVADLALLLSAIAGPTGRAPLALGEPGARFAEPLARDFRGVRVALFRAWPGVPFDPEIERMVRAQRSVLEGLGCIVEDADPDLSDADHVFRTERAFLMGGQIDPLRRDPAKRARMKADLLSEAELLDRLSALELAQAYRRKTALFARMRAFMETYEFYVLPTTQIHPFDVDLPYPADLLGRALDTYIDWQASCFLISATEHPALSVPCGFSADGLPVGMQIVGRHRDEWGLLQLGHAYERATGHGERRPPLLS